MWIKKLIKNHSLDLTLSHGFLMCLAKRIKNIILLSFIIYTAY